MYNNFVSDMTMLDQMRKEEYEERMIRGCVSETTFDMFDNIFDSVNNAREFLSIYERKASATKDRIGSTIIDLITADTLESYILTLCDSEENKKIIKNELVKKIATMMLNILLMILMTLNFLMMKNLKKKSTATL